MPLTREQVYNSLNGEEVKRILARRFEARLNEIPWLQRHLTLPRVRMKLSVTFELYADQPTPESHTIDDDLTLKSDAIPSSVTLPHPLEPQLSETVETEDLIDSSPLTGDPPDQIRDDHDIPILVPVRNKAARVIEDMPEFAQLSDGVTIHRPKVSPGPSPSRGATTVTQDFGPRIARTGESIPQLKNKDRAVNPALPYFPLKD